MLRFMKNIAFVIIALSLFFVTTRATAQKFNVGFTTGLSVSEINGANYISGNVGFHKVGVIAGAIINTSLTPKSLLQFEFNFIQKGSSQPPDSANNGYYKIALSYLEVPVLIRRRINFTMFKKPVSKIDLEGGLSFGRMISRNVTGSTNSSLPTGDLYNQTDISLLAGVDYNFSKNVYFCLRYSNSVIPAIKRNAPNFNFITYTFNRGNNMVLQFSFKFVFSGVAKSSNTTADQGSN